MQENSLETIELLSSLSARVQEGRGGPEGEGLPQLLLQEKVILLGLAYLRQGTIRATPFDLEGEVRIFVNAVNKIVMHNINHGKDPNARLLAKAIDILLETKVRELMPRRAYSSLRSRTFNNLSCVYKGQGKFQTALHAIE
jgi:hypothetical protein